MTVAPNRAQGCGRPFFGLLLARPYRGKSKEHPERAVDKRRHEAVDALDELSEQSEQRNVHCAVARMKQDLYRRLEPAGFIDHVGPENIFATLPTAVRDYAARFTAGPREILGP